MHDLRNNLPNGLSLVEVIVSSVLVGTLVVGSLSMLGSSVQTRTAARSLQADGPLLADMLLAEIMSMPYEEGSNGPIGRETGEKKGDRKQWDDVDDYNNWSKSPPRTKDHTELNRYSGWKREVTVDWAESFNGSASGAETGLKQIVVTVTSPPPASMETKRFGLRSHAGSLEQSPPADITIGTRIESTLKVGSAGQVRGVTNLLNRIEDPN